MKTRLRRLEGTSGSHAPGRGERWFAFAVAVGFLVFVLAQTAQHTMWRDEIRTWQVCRECTGLVSLWHAMRYEGVPVLWYWIVFGLTRMSDNPFLMQFVHALIATGVVYTVARWAPFPRFSKAIFALGYFPLFEYGTITRNYALVFLHLMIICVLISQPRVRLMPLMALLFLLTQVSIWGAGLAGLMLLVGVGKAYWSPPAVRPRTWEVVVAAAIVLTGVALCYCEVLPGPGPTFTATWENAALFDRVVGTLGSVYRGWFPVPAWSLHFWNTNALDGSPALQAVLGVVLAGCAVWLLLRRPVALAALVCAGAALLALEFRFHGVARHHGHLFMVLIVACWLAATTPSWPVIRLPSSAGSVWLDRVRGRVLGFVLAVHAIVGVGTAIAGMCLPFSASGAASAYIKRNVSDRTVLAALDDYCASPISQWVGRPIYFPQMRRFAWYNTQNGDARYPVTSADALIREIFELSESRNVDVLFMLSHAPTPDGDRMLFQQDGMLALPPAPSGRQRSLQVKVLPVFHDGVVADEGQRLYLFSARP